MKEDARVMFNIIIDIADRDINGQMGRTVRNAIDKLTDPYAKQERLVPIVSVLAKIKVRKGTGSSKEIQRVVRIQFPLILAWTSTVHKVQ